MIPRAFPRNSAVARIHHRNTNVCVGCPQLLLLWWMYMRSLTVRMSEWVSGVCWRCVCATSTVEDGAKLCCYSPECVFNYELENRARFMISATAGMTGRSSARCDYRMIVEWMPSSVCCRCRWLVGTAFLALGTANSIKHAQHRDLHWYLWRVRVSGETNPPTFSQ